MSSKPSSAAEGHAEWLIVPVGTVIMCLGLLYSGKDQPLLPFFGCAAVCLTLRGAMHVEKHGLLSLLPEATKSLLLQASPFELLARSIVAVLTAVASVLRLVILLCADATDAQRRGVLRGMAPGFRHGAFVRAAGSFLPRSARRLIFGRRGEAALAAQEAEAVRAIKEAARQRPPAPDVAPPPRRAASAAAAGGGREDRRGSAATANQEVDGRTDVAVCLALARNEVRGTLLGGPLLGKRSATQGLLAIARAASAAGLPSEAAAQVAGLERFLEAADAARTPEASAVAPASQGVCSGLLQFAAAPRTKLTAASALGGAVVCGSGGAAVGLTTGSLLGAAVGLVPAVFTFGLSIPIGAAIGGGLGLTTGATVGSAAGLAGGGAVGYVAYGAAQR